MKRLAGACAVLTVALVASGGIWGDEPAAKVRGTLPRNWNKLGLTDQQKQKVYTVQAEYRAKIEPLQKQITELRKKQQEAQIAVLTDAQRARLKEILTEAAGAATGDTKKPDTKKPAKPDEKKP